MASQHAHGGAVEAEMPRAAMLSADTPPGLFRTKALGALGTPRERYSLPQVRDTACPRRSSMVSREQPTARTEASAGFQGDPLR
eukprot:scaffold966_cov143-Pinguiococcus_pyrenoidosus.AAC.1